MAVVLVLLLVLLLSRDVTGCNFPDFLQSRSSLEDASARRDWRTHWRQYVVHHDGSSSASSTSARVSFDGDGMRSEEPTRSRVHQTGDGESKVANKTLRPPDRGHDHRHRHHQHSRLSFIRRCQQIVVDDVGQTRYLATHRQVGQSESKFICIEFVWRSSAVVQVGPTVHPLRTGLP